MSTIVISMGRNLTLALGMNVSKKHSKKQKEVTSNLEPWYVFNNSK
jgi:hypothetical protein